jgi:hypothetical protein
MRRIAYASIAVVPLIGIAVFLESPRSLDPASSPLSAALRVLPPIGSARVAPAEEDVLDHSLTDLLRVVVCRQTRSGACEPVDVFTSTSGSKKKDVLRLQGRRYRVVWQPDENAPRSTYEIHFDVAGLEIGFIDYAARTRRAVPLAFTIDRHPRIRGRALHAEGFTATQNAHALREEFGLDLDQVFHILSEEDYPLAETASALRDVFGLEGAQPTAQILKELGLSAAEVGTVLRDVFGLDAEAAAQIIEDIAFSVMDVASVLRDVFGLDAEATAQVLKDILPVVDLATVLRDVFALDSFSAAQVLADLGFTVSDLHEILTGLYGLSDICVENAFLALGFSDEEFLWITAGQYVSKYAPVLAFDKKANTFPMDAQKWFEEMLCGEEGGPPLNHEGQCGPSDRPSCDPADGDSACPPGHECVAWPVPGPGGICMPSEPLLCDPADGDPACPPGVMCHPNGGLTHKYEECQQYATGWTTGEIEHLWKGNADFSTLDQYGYAVPTYYKLRRCGAIGTGDDDACVPGQLRIQYYWFYGWQQNCDCCSGKHLADWEWIMVTLREDRESIAAVTFKQHKGWYTRRWSPVDKNNWCEICSDLGGELVCAPTACPSGLDCTNTACPSGRGTGHPVVFVGKTAHGSFHNDGGGANCLYYEDPRNPDSKSVWNTWETPLISLDGNEQDWLEYDRTADWYWGYTKVPTHPTAQGFSGDSTDLCDTDACRGKTLVGTEGCLRGYSNCRRGDTWCDTYKCANSAVACVFGSRYSKDYPLPKTDQEF